MEAGSGAREELEEEEQEVACECCGFTEECTAPYVAGVRARYGGRWICGLCGDAVAEEMGRAAASPLGPLSPAEALDRHARVCGQGRRASAPPSPGDELIAALRLLLRRRLGTPSPPRLVRSTPSSPRRDAGVGVSAASAVVTGPGAGGAGSLARTESCFAALVE